MKKKILIPIIGLTLFMVGCDDNVETKTEKEIDGFYSDVEVMKYHDETTNKNYILFQSHKGLQVLEDK